VLVGLLENVSSRLTCGSTSASLGIAPRWLMPFPTDTGFHMFDPIHGSLRLPPGEPIAPPERMSNRYKYSRSPVRGLQSRALPPQGYGPDDTIFRSICQEQNCCPARPKGDCPRDDRPAPTRQTALPARHSHECPVGVNSSGSMPWRPAPRDLRPRLHDSS
jgi:hypothetical protein